MANEQIEGHEATDQVPYARLNVDEQLWDSPSLLASAQKVLDSG